MNKFKSLLLGTAAAAIAATGAQAADAPMGREPVYRCDITGFIELPGTNICFRAGGFARLIVWGANEDAGTVEPVEGDALGGDDFGMYAQGRLNFDARRSTDHGTVRAFVEVQATDNNSNTGGALQLRHAFAQLGNWVFGKTSSTFLHGASSANGTDPTITGEVTSDDGRSLAGTTVEIDENEDGVADGRTIVLLDEPGGTYWTDFLKYVRDDLLDNGLISPGDLSLFKVTDNVEEAVEEVLGFYSVYNSMRFVRELLILRLHVEPSDEFVERLNAEFHDICETGRIEKAPVHRLEVDDEHLKHLPRLNLVFNRKAVGRLRQMVDVINCELEHQPPV